MLGGSGQAREPLQQEVEELQELWRRVNGGGQRHSQIVIPSETPASEAYGKEDLVKGALFWNECERQERWCWLAAAKPAPNSSSYIFRHCSYNFQPSPFVCLTIVIYLFLFNWDGFDPKEPWVRCRAIESGFILEIECPELGDSQTTRSSLPPQITQLVWKSIDCNYIDSNSSFKDSKLQFPQSNFKMSYSWSKRVFGSTKLNDEIHAYAGLH